MHTRINRRPNERGQMLIMAVLGMAVLLGSMAMAIDVGLFFQDRRHFQNSADAMALAGVAELPHNPSVAVQKAQDWGAINGVEPGEIKTIEVRTTGYPNDTLFVEVEGDFGWIFGRVLGMDTSRVGAKAAARVGTLVQGHSMMPWALLQGDSNCLDSLGVAKFGEDCVVKVGAGSSSITGWYGALDVDGTGGGSSEYNGNIIDGTTDWEYCIDGQDPPPCHGEVDNDFDEVFKPSGQVSPAYDLVCPNSPWLVIIPIVSYDSVPVHAVTIRGWTLGYLKDFGCFPNSVVSSSTEGAVVFGASAVTAGDVTSAAPATGDQVSKPCHHNVGVVHETAPIEDSFVMAIEPGQPIPGSVFGPARPPACHLGTPHGQQQCTPTPSPSPSPSPSPTPAPTGTPTPAPTASPTPGPSSTPGPTPSPSPSPAPFDSCRTGKGHWEVSITIADAAYSQTAGFLGTYDPTNGVIIRRLIE
jgi:Putative Flp pilus-assembly TadE/G-like